MPACGAAAGAALSGEQGVDDALEVLVCLAKVLQLPFEVCDALLAVPQPLL